jgi:hypothetical protein
MFSRKRTDVDAGYKRLLTISPLCNKAWDNLLFISDYTLLFVFYAQQRTCLGSFFLSFLTFIVHGNKQFWSLVINIKHVWLLFVISTKLKIVWGAPAIFTSWYRKLEKNHVWLNLSSYISVTKFIMVPNIIISLINM